jgi:N-acetylglucosaminyl-diphospho-decaprenol L-rhamnosyltransferase
MMPVASELSPCPVLPGDASGLVSVSIVSHAQAALAATLVSQLDTCAEVGQIVLTSNVPEAVSAASSTGCVQTVTNHSPQGFAANHNAAFRRCTRPYFCVLNPDIQLVGNPFPELLQAMQRDESMLTAPSVISPQGYVEDNARYFPTWLSLARKALGGHDGRYEIEIGQPSIAVDWVAGMFMLFRSEDFARLGGFDERYFLYYEDVDICARAWRAGMKVMVCPSVSVIHDARRDSHRSWHYMRWHLASMFHFLTSGLGSRS